MTALMTDQMGLLADAPNGITKLRELVLELAVAGRLCASESQWKVTQLRELVVSSGAGWSPGCEARPRSGDEWGVLKVSAVSWGKFRADENKALPAHLLPRPELEVQTGDFLVSRANTAELVARSVVVEHAPPKLMLSDKIVRLRLSEKCAPRFVQLANSAPAARSYYASVAGGTSSSMKNVSREQILSLPLRLPPLAEQHRIVAKVNELMAICDRLEARQQDAEAAHAQLVQDLLDSLTQARDAEDFRARWERVAEQFCMLFTTELAADRLAKVVISLGLQGRLLGIQGNSTSSPSHRSTWEVIPVGNAGEIKLGRQRSPKDHNGPNMVPYLRVANVHEARIDITDVKQMNFTPAEQETFQLRFNDLLLNEGQSRELVGRPAIYRDEVPGACFQNTLIRFRCGPRLLPEFALLFFRHCMHSGKFQSSSQQTTNIAHLSASRLAVIDMPLPPLDEQEFVIAAVTELLTLCDHLKTRIATARQKHSQLAEVLVANAVAPG